MGRGATLWAPTAGRGSVSARVLCLHRRELVQLRGGLVKAQGPRTGAV